MIFCYFTIAHTRERLAHFLDRFHGRLSIWKFCSRNYDRFTTRNCSLEFLKRLRFFIITRVRITPIGMLFIILLALIANRVHSRLNFTVSEIFSLYFYRFSEIVFALIKTMSDFHTSLRFNLNLPLRWYYCPFILQIICIAQIID